MIADALVERKLGTLAGLAEGFRQFVLGSSVRDRLSPNLLLPTI